MMKVLFVSSAKTGDVGHVVRNQGESLQKDGVEIDYLIIEPGVCGYLRAISRIKRAFREGGYDLVHAHYSLSAFSATLAGVKPLVVSLMGSDAFAPWVVRVIIRILSSLIWSATIIKTEEMKARLRLARALVLPNGVDLMRFAPVDKSKARAHLNLATESKVILFITMRDRPEKDLPLAMRAIKSLNENSVEFIHLYDKQNSEIAWYLNAADLLLLTSKREGGVNVIKEAMACNCPIVSTDVGDVRYVISDTQGCYVSGHDENSLADNIRKALAFRQRTNGRLRITELGLDSSTVAKKIIDIYLILKRRG